MAEKVTYGLKNLYYAQKTEDAAGVPAFGTPKAMIGASEMTLSPVGEVTPIYADDIIYYKARSNQGYDGSVSVRQIPEDFKVNHIGEYKDTNGVLIEKSNVVPYDFAFLGEFQVAGDETGDSTGKRFALYNCSAGRTDLAGKSKEDAIDPNMFEVPITANPTVSDEIVKASVKRSDNQSVYDAWFDSVYYNPSYAVLYTVTVTVTEDVGGDPIAGALVVVGDKVGITNSSGIARILQPNGTYDVVTSASGFTAEVTSVTVSSAAASVDVGLA